MEGRHRENKAVVYGVKRDGDCIVGGACGQVHTSLNFELPFSNCACDACDACRAYPKCRGAASRQMSRAMKIFPSTVFFIAALLIASAANKQW